MCLYNQTCVQQLQTRENAFTTLGYEDLAVVLVFFRSTIFSWMIEGINQVKNRRYPVIMTHVTEEYPDLSEAPEEPPNVWIFTERFQRGQLGTMIEGSPGDFFAVDE